jgi:hypothetical protein
MTRPFFWIFRAPGDPVYHPPSLKALIPSCPPWTRPRAMGSQPASRAPATTQEPKWKRNTAYVKPEEQLGEGDTTLIKDFLPECIAVGAFEKLKEEVQWQTMYHHGEYAPVPLFPCLIEQRRWRGSAASRCARRDLGRWMVGITLDTWFYSLTKSLTGFLYTDIQQILPRLFAPGHRLWRRSGTT